MRLTNQYAGIFLSKTDIKNLMFALNTLDQDQNTRGGKMRDAMSVKAHATFKELMFRLGVIDY